MKINELWIALNEIFTQNQTNFDLFYLLFPLSVAPSVINRSMTIPNTLIGCVIGTGGTIMKSIYQSSGAKLVVSTREGNNDRTVTITGTSKSVASAMDMIRNKYVIL